MQIKKITSLVLAAALSISLAACGNSQTTAVTSSQDTIYKCLPWRYAVSGHPVSTSVRNKPSTACAV